MLALQRQIGNAAVGRLVAAQRAPVDGASSSSSSASAALEQVAPLPVSALGLDSFPEVSVTVPESLREQPAYPVSDVKAWWARPAYPVSDVDAWWKRPELQAPAVHQDPLAAPPAVGQEPVPSPVAADQIPLPAQTEDEQRELRTPREVEEQPTAETLGKKSLRGDVPKGVGALVAEAGPAINQRVIDLQMRQQPTGVLPAGGVGMASASAVGDAISEAAKWAESRDKSTVNWGKMLAGVVTAAGIWANAGGMGGQPSVGARIGGLYTQGVGLGIKGAGEAWKPETAAKDGVLAGFKDGDYLKMAGAFISVAAPILQAHGIRVANAGGNATIWNAVSAGLAGGTALGDFGSEAYKMLFAEGLRSGVTIGKVNLGKMMGGLFGAVGAGLNAGGIASNDPYLRIAGLTVQEAGLLFKALGEGVKLENLPMGDAPALAAWLRTTRE